MEKLYRLVFKGELLTGHDPAEIRSRASLRLGANTQQTERLFSGQSVILKRGLAMDAAARYAKELRLLGMRMHVELDVTTRPAKPAQGTGYRIVFQGELVPGFVAEEVAIAAAERLNASVQQIATLFSGRKTTLKKGLDPEQARRYVSRLRNIGMVVRAEEESASMAPVVPPVAPAVQVPPPAPIAQPVAYLEEPEGAASHAVTLIHTPLMQASDLLHTVDVPVDMDFTQTMVDHELIATNAQNALPDLEKTELAGEASLQAYMRGEPLPVDATPVYVPPPRMPVPPAASASTAGAIPGQEDADGIVAAGAAASNPAQPLRVCAGCGARQQQGRYCIHCGYEFVREARGAVTAPDPQVGTVRDETPALTDDTPPPRRNGVLYVVLLLLGVVVLGFWWLRQ
ncbi:hypothetical protein VVD49_16995 [Uliginosibacterium sp. H3]|uniref:Uncharacterized protein n=1 Tax=Uliginosibacterium silvisoli TaxID=3114758 RepID=A0ABU6K6U1_9RHOO|nr:hypothetical protein [Uliginosibacterium sp. H3]